MNCIIAFFDLIVFFEANLFNRIHLHLSIFKSLVFIFIFLKFRQTCYCIIITFDTFDDYYLTKTSYSNDTWLIGSSFIQAFFTEFDFDAKRIGFARKNRLIDVGGGGAGDDLVKINSLITRILFKWIKHFFFSI